MLRREPGGDAGDSFGGPLRGVRVLLGERAANWGRPLLLVTITL